MANFLLNNAFRFSVNCLNFLSPSLVTDILLHPFDFATVLLQIGYDPEGVKYKAATLVSVILQYAIFSFYIPYFLTSMHGMQFMGMPHPSIFYYVNYIYSKEGIKGCYRGLLPKICERLIMITVNEKIRCRINKDSLRIPSNELENETNQENFLQALINGACSQFFAVLASHPFHVLMVSSFAEFTYNKKSSVLELFRTIYMDDGYFGFFTGLSARLLGELVSLIFSITYTTIINKQRRPATPVVESSLESPAQKTAMHFVNYFTDASRFTSFKSKSMHSEPIKVAVAEDFSEPNALKTHNRILRLYAVFRNFLRDITRKRPTQKAAMGRSQVWQRSFPVLASRLFYYVMLRDYLSKKLSHPFFLVCHSAIVLDTGWDKFPLLNNLNPLVDFIQAHLKPCGKKQTGSTNTSDGEPMTLCQC